MEKSFMTEFEDQEIIAEAKMCIAKGADNMKTFTRQQPQNKPARRREFRSWVKVAAGAFCVAMIYALIVMAML